MINFHCEPQLLGAIPNPVHAVKATPKFFKNIKPQLDSHPSTGTVKRCVPFLDALSSGFIIPMWADMYVVAKDGEITMDFPPNFQAEKMIDQHNYEQVQGHPMASKAYGRLAFKFINPWVVETDDGVSCLFTSPLNHLETRFKILDGVVDTDTYYNNVNLPFLWTGGDGEFLIERGTPLVQVIPMRREQHEVHIGAIDGDKRQKTVSELGTYFRNAYRSAFWHNKKAEPQGL